MIMYDKNIFMNGGIVSGESMIGYNEYYESLKREANAKLAGTGGIYVYGLYRMGKTSLVNRLLDDMAGENVSNLIFIQLNLALFDSSTSNAYDELLEEIVKKIGKGMKKCGADTEEYQIAREEFLCKMNVSNFLDVVESAAEEGCKMMMVLDEFDSAETIFRSKSDFEAFRLLASFGKYSTCLITVSRQELSMIEHENPRNSTFKGVMEPFPIRGFNDDDIREYCRIIKDHYEYELTDEDLENIKYYAGASPYLWSCIGHIIANLKMMGADVDITEILQDPSFISTRNGFHSSILRCLEKDKDRDGVTSAEKLASVIIGPSFLATRDDIELFVSMNYLIDTGTEYIVFSPAFKNYLMSRSYNNDILNNFALLENKIKDLLDGEKSRIFSTAGASATSDDENWLSVLDETWKNLESRSFNPCVYHNQITGTYRKFNKTETILNVMSLEDGIRIIRNYWSIFSCRFNNDTKDKWENKLIECGKARNPVHHGSSARLYSKEEKEYITAYCLQIIKQLA